MASSLIKKALNRTTLTALLTRRLSSTATASNSFTFSSPNDEEDDKIHVKGRPSTKSTSSVTMPMSFMTGSIVGKRFYKEVSTRAAVEGVGWHVMLDYRTLKSPSKRPLKLPTLGLAKAIAAEWEYQG